MFFRIEGNASQLLLTAIAVWLVVYPLAVTSFLFPASPFAQPIFGDGPCDGSLADVDQSSECFEKAVLDRLKVPQFARGAARYLAPIPRNVTVWLPPGYHHENNQNIQYPVLYCHDGQNAVSDDESWTGYSWRLTGALCSLVRRGFITPDKCPIVVLIPSSSDEFLVPFVRRRHLEYESSVWGQVYVDIIADTIKPLVDKQFRTSSNPQHTMSIGSSMGGQIALLTAIKHPDKFGGAAALSPYFSASVLADLALKPDVLRGKRLYIDNGGDNDDLRVPILDILDHIPKMNPGYFWLDTQLQPAIDAARNILKFHRIPHAYQKFPGARHNERAWAMRIDKPLMHLFGNDKAAIL
jgi:enterochelin esterase-like enzyme